MAVDDRLSDLLVDWEQGHRAGCEPTLEELCRDAPELLPVVRESIDSLKATAWMLEPDELEGASFAGSLHTSRAALHDTELPASHLTAAEFAASIFESGLLSPEEIADINRRLAASDLTGEAREVASKLVSEGKLTRYQASVLLKASNDPLLVDNYVILETLDTGGMGLVFKAMHRSMNRVVALKLLPSAMMSARDTVKRFQREVKAAAALQHPNIVAAYDADESAEVAYLVLEYVEGTNLYRLVTDEGPLSVARAVDCVRQAALGLAYLHSRGIIHRDVKPANLILAKDGTVKLLDMGLVRFASSEDLSSAETDQNLTQAGIVIGTVAYMSPEQALDTRSADQRSDIYSLGATLFFLLTGRSLYHEDTGMKTLLAHREQAVPTIRQFREDVPVTLDTVFRTMVAKRPADRLQTMSEVVAALDACGPGLSTDAPGRAVTQTLAPPAKLATPARKLPIALAIAALAAATLGAAYFGGWLIRIKTANGNVEFRTPDSKASVEIVPPDTTASEKGAAGASVTPAAAPLVPGAGFPKAKDVSQARVKEKGAGRRGGRSKDVASSAAPGGLVEHDLFDNDEEVLSLSDGNRWNVHCAFVALIPADAIDRFDTVIQPSHQLRIGEAMHRILRRTKIEDLRDPEHEVLKQTIKTEVNKLLPEPVIQGIVVTLMEVEPVDRAASPAAADKSSAAQSGNGAGRAKNTKAISPHAGQPATPSKGGTGAVGLGNLIETPLFPEADGRFMLSDGKPWHVHIAIVALIAPNKETQARFEQARDETHHERIEDAMNRVLRSTKIEDLRDPQLEVFKRTIMTEVNKVLPEPLIQGIVAHVTINEIPRGILDDKRGADKEKPAKSGDRKDRPPTTNGKEKPPATPSKGGGEKSGGGLF